MKTMMPAKFNIARPVLALVAAAVIAAALTPRAANAQVAVIVNGAPITQLDIDQRTKLLTLLTNKVPTRQQSLDELINDQLKLSVAKRYSFEVGNNEVDEAYSNMARRVRMTPEQLTQSLATKGIQVAAMKARLRADITWSQIVRSRYSSTLLIGESEVNRALRSNNLDDKDEVGYAYTLYPITLITPRNAGQAVLEEKRKLADTLRGQFTNCKDGLARLRLMRDVAVSDSILRNSADLSPQTREMLGKMEVGQLTPPDISNQGLQVFALCDKKQTTAESPAKKEMRDKLFAQRYDNEAKKFLDDLRKQAMIEYR